MKSETNPAALEQAALEKQITDQVGELAQVLLQQGTAITVAESCTGGLLAASLTDMPGSSAWFEQGWVTYSNAAKTDLLGVPLDLLDEHGAVSLAVVEAMAAGALASCPAGKAGVAVSISGVAGPDGGTPNKPVGTVCFGLADQTGVISWQRRFEGDRQQVRWQAVSEALSGVLSRN